MNKHPNKEIRAAIDYALTKGWRLRTGNGQSHCWGILYCPANERGGCSVSVFSTPKNPYSAARIIRQKADKCPHKPQEREV
jgi:hypothetical protein